MKIYLLVNLALMFLLLSCNDNTTQPQLQQLDSLTGTTWKWEQYVNEKGQLINVADSTLMPFVITFESDTTITGRSGCNTFGANYHKKEDKIGIGIGFSTEVWCLFTDVFLKYLSGAYKIISATENELILQTKYSSCQVMYFTRNTSVPKLHAIEENDIDMNQDNTVDFKFIYENEIYNDSITGQHLYIVPLNENQTAPAFACVDIYEPIDNNIRFYSKRKDINSCLKHSFGWYDYWMNSLDKKYLPIKLKLNDGFHFGWICISTSRINGDLTIHDFGYNKTPEQMILAGVK